MVKGKGTQSFGKRHTKVHSLCKRCGKKTFHIQSGRCASCGYPDAKTRKYPGWHYKALQKRGTGTGRMRFLKHVNRRFKNGFRAGTVAVRAHRAAKTN